MAKEKIASRNKRFQNNNKVSKSHLSKVLKNFINFGFKDIFVCINYLGNKIIKDLKWAQNEKIICPLLKKKFLGTAGPLSIINFYNKNGFSFKFRYNY